MSEFLLELAAYKPDLIEVPPKHTCHLVALLHDHNPRFTDTKLSGVHFKHVLFVLPDT